MLTGRYLEYGRWLDGAARRAQRAHYLLRITALVGGVLLPAVASLDALSDTGALRWVTVGIGVMVGLSVAIDGFMNLRERWLHFRLAAETVLSELWQFATLSGERYEGKESYEDAFPTLVVECERFIATEVATYVKGPARESSDAGGGTDPNRPHDQSQ